MKSSLPVKLLIGTVLLLGLHLPSARVRATGNAAADKYSVDAIHSSIIFRIKHVNAAYFYGRFNEVTGSFSIDAGNPAASKIEIEVKVDSIDTHNEARDKHLKSPDFFEVDKHPGIKFVASSLKKTGDNKYEVEGDLTIRGVTKKLTAPLEWTGTGKGMQGEERGGLETVFTIKRSDFGVSGLPQALGDEVKLMISLEGVKQ